MHYLSTYYTVGASFQTGYCIALPKSIWWTQSLTYPLLTDLVALYSYITSYHWLRVLGVTVCGLV